MPRLDNNLVLALLAICVGGLTATGFSVPASADPNQRDGQVEARRELRAGNVQTLRQIESRVLPRMRDMDYLGMDEFVASTYRLKFIKDGRVVFVDVDARTGRIINVLR
ncbi:PepSY domain-containing protein [Croceicoccus sp. F390]|uniref:PepSY domain-containing protein n=1 Tax=Croceicoccus esteveae TaxID=3075597 RepID=A0ABU2ZIX7_9SPHN|nr:PepSY domain-containing protein [Croceicoccus sp. F390]MDT0576549.1 PepSY domain-containing protein [Croceicoccus sp. F390]